METRIVDNILKFLVRAELKGTEVVAFNECVKSLVDIKTGNAILAKAEKEPQEGKPENDEDPATKE